MRATVLATALVLAGCHAGDAGVLSGTEGASGTSGAAAETGTASATDGGAASAGGTGSSAFDVPPVCETPALDEQGLLEAGEQRPGVALPRCTRHRYFVVAAASSAHHVQVTADGPVRVSLRYPDDSGNEPPLAFAEGAGLVDVPLYAPRSGEFAVWIESEDGSPRTYDVAFACTAACDLETTRFPVLFVHGWTGFLQIGPVEYFYGVGEYLGDRGFPVFFPVLDPYNGHEVRGAQLAEAIDGILAQARARKVDVIAHSQGGLDARYVISTLGYGDRIDALYTVATPHRGTPLADIALGLQDGPAGTALAFLLETVGATGGFDSDAEASFWSLSETFVQGSFNPANPDDPRVDYHSWMGRTCLSELSCGDVVDAPILTGYEILTQVAGDNDGVVPVSSAPWGEYHGTVPADHFDEVGQVAGATGSQFDHLAFYLDRVRDLRDAGH
ncbi:MAG: hypothetical protein D6705_05780 [Deltaproteobacteria bacterium]|nr:MAG: hypothetical protein D6705_05780 [Deltaproteobacteria bacterium]